MYCTKCGAAISEGGNFCESCGAPVTVTHQEHVDEKAKDFNLSVSTKKGWSMSRLFEGRLGRVRYFEGGLLSFAPSFILVSLWGIINILTGTISLGSSAATAVSSGTSMLINVINNIIVPILFAAAFIFLIPSYFSVATRRCHDLGHRGWVSIGTFIPYVGVIVGLYLLFKKGKIGPNEFGPEPARGRRFFADIFNYVL